MAPDSAAGPVDAAGAGCSDTAMLKAWGCAAAGPPTRAFGAAFRFAMRFFAALFLPRFGEESELSDEDDESELSVPVSESDEESDELEELEASRRLRRLALAFTFVLPFGRALPPVSIVIGCDALSVGGRAHVVSGVVTHKGFGVLHKLG